MGRVERRMYANARTHFLMRRVLAALTVLVVLAGLMLRRGARTNMEAEHIPPPTATPVTAAFDETVQTREITLEACSWYAIQTGIYSSDAAARDKADTYAQRGAPGYVCRDGGKWRVLIACYGAREDAAAVRDRLSEGQGVETYLHTWTCPELALRLSGMAGQLDVAEAGLTLMLHAAAVLRDQAALLDAGETALQDAEKTVDALDEQIRLWRDTARARFTSPYPALVEAELTLARDWEAKAKALRQAGDATALSAAMKLQAMAIFDECCAMRRQMME